MGTTWTTVTDDITASGEWTTDVDAPAANDGLAWQTVLSTTAAKKDTFLGVTEAAEDFDINPEDVVLEPKLTQNSGTGWTLEIAETD